MDQQSNEYSLYIPRVALSSSSSSSKSSNRVRQFANIDRRANGELTETSGESESEGIYGSSIRHYDGLRANRNRINHFVHKAPKRGSHSTKSSSSSSSASNYVRSNNNVCSL